MMEIRMVLMHVIVVVTLRHLRVASVVHVRVLVVMIVVSVNLVVILVLRVLVLVIPMVILVIRLRFLRLLVVVELLVRRAVLVDVLLHRITVSGLKVLHRHPRRMDAVHLRRLVTLPELVVFVHHSLLLLLHLVQLPRRVGFLPDEVLAGGLINPEVVPVRGLVPRLQHPHGMRTEVRILSPDRRPLLQDRRRDGGDRCDHRRRHPRPRLRRIYGRVRRADGARLLPQGRPGSARRRQAPRRWDLNHIPIGHHTRGSVLLRGTLTPL